MSRSGEFDEFVRGSGSRLLRLAVLLTGDRPAAEDLLQEVLERMYVRWRGIHTSPEAYARQALANAAASRWRRRARRPEISLAEPHDRPASDEVELVATRAELAAVLRDLPPRQRAVIVLRFYEDLTTQQVAGILGCSAATVRSQTCRALTKLRQRRELSALERR